MMCNAKSLLCLLWLMLPTLPMAAHSAVILQYHHVSDDTPKITSISPDLFKEHMAYLEENQFQIWSLPRLVKQLKNDQSIPDKVVVITFDDAYTSIYENAYPLLRKKDWPFTIFVATDPVDKRVKPFMSWQQLKELAKKGVTIANHTKSHGHLVRNTFGSTREWLDHVESEITHAQERIKQELGQDYKLLAYPYGEFTKEIEERVAKLGYVGFGQHSGAAGSSHALTALPRFPMNNIYGKLENFPTKVSALPFSAIVIEPDKRIMKNAAPLKSGFKIVFPLISDTADQLRCYLSGRGQIETTKAVKSDTLVVTTAPIETGDISPGRSRINCTMPAKAPYQGRYYWFSHFWMTLLPNGEWYPEP